MCHLHKLQIDDSIVLFKFVNNSTGHTDKCNTTIPIMRKKSRGGTIRLILENAQRNKS